jgi:hypothetical protein
VLVLCCLWCYLVLSCVVLSCFVWYCLVWSCHVLSIVLSRFLSLVSSLVCLVSLVFVSFVSKWDEKPDSSCLASLSSLCFYVWSCSCFVLPFCWLVCVTFVSSCLLFVVFVSSRLVFVIFVAGVRVRVRVRVGVRVRVRVRVRSIHKNRRVFFSPLGYNG